MLACLSSFLGGVVEKCRAGEYGTSSAGLDCLSVVKGVFSSS